MGVISSRIKPVSSCYSAFELVAVGGTLLLPAITSPIPPFLVLPPFSRKPRNVDTTGVTDQNYPLASLEIDYPSKGFSKELNGLKAPLSSEPAIE